MADTAPPDAAFLEGLEIFARHLRDNGSRALAPSSRLESEVDRLAARTPSCSVSNLVSAGQEPCVQAGMAPTGAHPMTNTAAASELPQAPARTVIPWAPVGQRPHNAQPKKSSASCQGFSGRTPLRVCTAAASR
ncbi:hypothetical protein GCM10010304_81210 [Streptomyces roseoviolaceus]